MLTHAAAAAQQTIAGTASPPAAASGTAAEQAAGPAWAAAAAAESLPLLPLSLSVKGFPWPALTLDLGATAAALFFNMLLVFAFLQPTRAGEEQPWYSPAGIGIPASKHAALPSLPVLLGGCLHVRCVAPPLLPSAPADSACPTAAVAAILQEKELLLREGMRILGLQVGMCCSTPSKARQHTSADLRHVWVQRRLPLLVLALVCIPTALPLRPPSCLLTFEQCLSLGPHAACLQDGAYWASWFLTHWAGMAFSGLLCAIIGLYPFAHSRWGLEQSRSLTAVNMLDSCRLWNGSCTAAGDAERCRCTSSYSQQAHSLTTWLALPHPIHPQLPPHARLLLAGGCHAAALRLLPVHAVQASAAPLAGMVAGARVGP